jgi:hypothetical protein
MSSELGIFSDRLKLAVIKPLHKRRDTGNTKNYRPISVLSTFSKILGLIAFITKK